MNKIAAAGVLFSISSGAFAQASAQPESAKANKDPSQVICETQKVPGSRVGAKRVCMTRAEWADLKAQDRQAVERTQTARGSKGE